MCDSIISALKKNWDHLIKQGQDLKFHRSQALFYEGHHPYGLFVLVWGRVGFERKHGRCPEEHLWIAPSGQVIGLGAFFSGTTYCCTCTATEECRVIFIPKSQLAVFFPRQQETLTDDLKTSQ